MASATDAGASKAADARAGGDVASQDLTEFVQSLLTEMQQKFQRMSETIIGRIDDMGTRIDELEKSIGDLMQQAGVDEDGGKGDGGD